MKTVSENTGLDKKIREELVTQLFAGIPVGLTAVLFVATWLTVIFWGVIDSNTLIAWLTCTYLICIGRGGFFYYFRQHSQPFTRSIRFWEYGFLIGTSLSGLMWALPSLLFYPEQLDYQVILAFAAGGVSAAAIATLSFNLVATRVYVLLALCPLIYRMAESGVTTLQIMSLMIVMFLILLFVTSKRLHKSYSQNIRLNIQSNEREITLQNNIAALQSLHEISINTESDFEEKLTRFLDLGIKIFGLQTGMISQIKDGTYTITHISGMPLTLSKGDTYPIEDTLCEKTFSSSQPCSYHDISESPLASHRFHSVNNINAYIGAIIYVENQPYGTLSFVSTESLPEPFGEYHGIMIHFLAQWLGNEIGRTNFEQTLSQFKTTLDLTQDSIFFFEPENFRFIYANEGGINKIGYSHDELMEMTPADIQPNINSSIFQNIVSPLLSEKKSMITYETIQKNKFGEEIPVEIFLQYIKPSGEKPRFIYIAHDITERKRIDKMKDEFVSTVSHELRTPLTSIRGAIGILSGGLMGSFSVEQKKILTIANNNTERLLNLINDILDIQKIGAGKLQYHFSNIDINEVIKQAIIDNTGFADVYQVSFVFRPESGPVNTIADHDRLIQVMNNLLSNAAKFSPQGGNVEVSCEKMGEMARVSVKDFGPGIPREFQQRLFQKFTQVDSSNTRKPGSTGLGLSIAKLIVEHHGGHIGCNSRKGEGATFYFDLPISAEISQTESEKSTNLNQ